jgi:hypothetical protein
VAQGDVVGHGTHAALLASELVLAIRLVEELQRAFGLCGRKLPVQLGKSSASSRHDHTVLGQDRIDTGSGSMELSKGGLDAAGTLLPDCPHDLVRGSPVTRPPHVAISIEDGRSRVRFASRWSRCFCSASASCCASRSAQS